MKFHEISSYKLFNGWTMTAGVIVGAISAGAVIALT